MHRCALATAQRCIKNRVFTNCLDLRRKAPTIPPIDRPREAAFRPQLARQRSEVVHGRARGKRAGASAASGRWPDWCLVALLLLLAVALRGWLLAHTEVAARDSIGFIRYALQFEGQAQPPDVKTWTWRDVIKANHQHPGYPLTVLAVSVPVRYFLGTTPQVMQLSGQIASGLAAVLLVIPMFYLGRALFDRGVGFWAALLFQCLPVSGHILSDGLSEALFLLLTTTSLLFAVLAVRGNQWRYFVLCGVFCG